MLNITQRKKMEEQLKYLSLHDSVTGLYNRAYFEEEMRRLEGGRSPEQGIIVCDVDGLKLVNDSLGHDTGDALLVAAAGVIIAMSPPDMIPIADWILKHHEWWNGQGYPLGLKGEEIPLECRILAIADAYDAMTSDRPYRKAISHQEAVAEITRCAGTQFDPHLVPIFLKVLENKQ